MVNVCTPQPHTHCSERSAKKRRAPFSRFQRRPTSSEKFLHDNGVPPSKRHRSSLHTIDYADGGTQSRTINECVSQSTVHLSAHAPPPIILSKNKSSSAENEEAIDSLSSPPPMPHTFNSYQTPPPARCKNSAHLLQEDEDNAFALVHDNLTPRTPTPPSPRCEENNSSSRVSLKGLRISCLRTPQSKQESSSSSIAICNSTPVGAKSSASKNTPAKLLPAFPVSCTTTTTPERNQVGTPKRTKSRSQLAATLDDYWSSSSSSSSNEDDHVDIINNRRRLLLDNNSSSLLENSPNAASALAIFNSPPSSLLTKHSATPSPRTPSDVAHSPPKCCSATPVRNSLEGIKLLPVPTPGAPLRPTRRMRDSIREGILTSNKRTVSQALAYGADPNVEMLFEQDAERILPILAAAALGQASIVRCLLDGGAALKSVNSSGQTALHLLSILPERQRNREQQKLQQMAPPPILKKRPTVFHQKQLKEWNDLENCLAALSSDITDVTDCLSLSRHQKEHATTPVPQTDKPPFYLTPLRNAAFHSCFLSLENAVVSESDLILTAKVLIAAGIDVSWKDEFGKMAIDYARQAGLFELEDLLLQSTSRGNNDKHLSNNSPADSDLNILQSSSSEKNWSDVLRCVTKQQARRQHASTTSINRKVNRAGTERKTSVALTEELLNMTLPVAPLRGVIGGRVKRS